MQESYLMSEDYTLYIEDCPLENIYYELPLLIKSFNLGNEIEIYGLKKWFKDFTNLNKQLENCIASVKELQDFAKSSPDKKEEAETKIAQLVAELKTKLIEKVYNDVAGAYLNKLAQLPNDEILMKCIVNEHFAATLKSINLLFLNTETQNKFSDIIEEYEVEKDKLEINFQDLIVMEDLVRDEILTKCKINEHFVSVLKAINQLILDAQTQENSSDITDIPHQNTE